METWRAGGGRGQVQLTEGDRGGWGGGVAFLPYIVTVSSPFAFLLQLIFRPSQKVFLFFLNIKDKKTGSAQVNRQHHTNPPPFSKLLHPNLYCSTNGTNIKTLHSAAFTSAWSVPNEDVI